MLTVTIRNSNGETLDVWYFDFGKDYDSVDVETARDEAYYEYSDIMQDNNIIDTYSITVEDDDKCECCVTWLEWDGNELDVWDKIYWS